MGGIPPRNEASYVPAWCVSTKAKTAEASVTSVDATAVETVGLDLPA